MKSVFSARNPLSTRLTRVCTCALACMLPACGPAGDGPPLAVERDSAGITIVESLGPAWGDSARWRVDPEPLLDLAESGTGDPHNFYQVRDVKRLPDGGIVVVNRGSNEIRTFSADGSFVGAAGGHGEGPGEFTNLQQVEVVGDSLLARDIRSRVTLFGPDLQHIRTMEIDDDVTDVRYLGDGTLIVRAVTHYPEVYGVIRPPEVLLAYDLEGVQRDSIGPTPGSEMYVAEMLSGPPLFGKESVLDTRDGRIFTGSSDEMQIEEIGASGEIVRVLRIPDYPLALTPNQVEEERQARLDIPLPQGVTSLPPPFVQAIEEMPSPEARPAYADMLADPTGAVWLRPFLGQSERGGPEHWVVLGADGAWLGSVEIPADFRVTEVGVDEILGVWTSEFDVQHPQVWRLRR
ncbi:MAG: hypothetical protein OXH66_19130 [Gemmatimonadetes bacterium]|nr:hypothetical protein [Gemmatimonadota bacterium]MYA10602.1 hypothetical protein [Gemmatimonadota bacterium]MYE93132.1 hypothetical protein [Gemmatimonadota bacterium]MYJ12489.1 hypothetical protein [Gemmatimonadota bacterium]